MAEGGRMVSFALALVACSSDPYLGHPPGLHEAGDVGYPARPEEGATADAQVRAEAAHWPETAWTWRGQFEIDESTALVAADGTVTGSWFGFEETEVAVNDEVACTLHWTMHENRALSAAEVCVDCSDTGWDVTCDSGHIAGGDDCGTYFREEYYTPPQTFAMAFAPAGDPDNDGVTAGMVWYLDPGYPVWYEGPEATFDGQILVYARHYVDTNVP